MQGFGGNYRIIGVPDYRHVDYLCTEESVIRVSWMRVMSVLESHRFQDVSRTDIRDDLCRDTGYSLVSLAM